MEMATSLRDVQLAAAFTASQIVAIHLQPPRLACRQIESTSCVISSPARIDLLKSVLGAANSFAPDAKRAR